MGERGRSIARLVLRLGDIMTIKGFKLRECKLTFCGPPIFLHISRLINLQDDTRTADIQQSTSPSTTMLSAPIIDTSPLTLSPIRSTSKPANTTPEPTTTAKLTTTTQRPTTTTPKPTTTTPEVTTVSANGDISCDTSYCSGLAYNMNGYMNTTVDKCIDFYSYACGTWVTSRTQAITAGTITNWMRSIEEDNKINFNLKIKGITSI